jgi:RNA polymerase sigma-70 factor (ECF subfamily)
METAPSDDADLLRAYARGDGAAFEGLYDRYDRACFQFIRRTLGAAHSEATEDIHQETWMAVARNAGTFDADKAAFRAWLFAIARNKVWDHFRKQKVAFLTSADDEAAARVPDAGPTPLEAVQSRETARAVVAAVEGLPPAQRETFVMFAAGGLSLGEIAAVTEVGVETTKSRLRYARATLKRLLTPQRSAHG